MSTRIVERDTVLGAVGHHPPGFVVVAETEHVAEFVFRGDLHLPERTPAGDDPGDDRLRNPNSRSQYRRTPEDPLAGPRNGLTARRVVGVGDDEVRLLLDEVERDVEPGVGHGVFLPEGQCLPGVCLQVVIRVASLVDPDGDCLTGERVSVLAPGPVETARTCNRRHPDEEGSPPHGACSRPEYVTSSPR